MSDFRNQIRSQLVTGTYSKTQPRLLTSREYMIKHGVPFASSQCGNAAKITTNISPETVIYFCLITVVFITSCVLFFKSHMYQQGIMTLTCGLIYCFYLLLKLSYEPPSICIKEFSRQNAVDKQKMRHVSPTKKLRPHSRKLRQIPASTYICNDIDEDISDCSSMDNSIIDNSDNDDTQTNPILRRFYGLESDLHSGCISISQSSCIIPLDDNCGIDCSFSDSTFDDLSMSDDWN